VEPYPSHFCPLPSEPLRLVLSKGAKEQAPIVDLVEGNCCGCVWEWGTPEKLMVNRHFPTKVATWEVHSTDVEIPGRGLEYVLFYSIYLRWKSHTTSKFITGSSTCATVLLRIWRQRRDVSCVDIYSTLPIPKASSEGLAGSIPKGQVNLYVVVVHPIYCMFVRYS